MQNRYFSYIDQRAAQRRMKARFANPRGLAIHIAIFVSVMLAIWGYGTTAGLWFYQINYPLPTWFGLLWSIVIAIQAVRHFRRSAAWAEQREIAVEEEMRQFIEKNGESLDDETLFAMHRNMEAELARQSHWSTALTAFAIVNLLSWLWTANYMGTSWAFQMTLPTLIVVTGGVKLFLHWWHERRTGSKTFLSRLPLWHVFLYPVGAFGLILLMATEAINRWDAENIIIVWGAALLIHIALMVVILPILQNLMATVSPTEKRKGMPQLALAADGELVERFSEDDVEAYEVVQARKKR